MMRTFPFITVTAKVTGFHSWHTAPDEVLFLAHHHRHTFHIKVRVAVSHQDRQVEFTLLKKDIEAHLQKYPKIFDGIDFGGNSCEMLSEALAKVLVDSDYDVVMVSFSEDGEFEGGVQVDARR